MTTSSRNDITGDKLQSKVNTKQYEDGYDRIFGKKDKVGTLWLVRDLFNEAWGKPDCNECVFLLETEDWVPYGEGNTKMTTYTCDCRDPHNCLYVMNRLEDMQQNEDN